MLDLHADLPRALSADRELNGRFTDGTHPERIGWRDVVVASAADHTLPIRARSVALIGLAGGLVPSASAFIVLLVAVSEGQLLLGAVLIAAFGVGMALVLGGLGVGVAAARSRIRRRGSQLGNPPVRRLATAVPVLAALVVV